MMHRPAAQDIGPLLASALLLMQAILTAATPARASSIVLEQPVECVVGKDCFIQSFFDHDTGPGWRDYACGTLSYDGHTGTDFRAPDLAAMERGIRVVAAAPGVVKAVRDGMSDVSVKDGGRMALAGRDAGNGVVIDHGGGWETQYSHLRQGSIRVRPGERVRDGTELGLVGLSGNTEFPHVELLVRRDGRPVDPFTGQAGSAGCADVTGTLWSPSALGKLAYRPTALLTAGFSPGPPDVESARRGLYPDSRPAEPGQPLVLWAEVLGARAGDVQSFEILGPDNTRMYAQEAAVPADKAVWLAYGGQKAPQGGWPKGGYTGRMILIREGRVVLEAERRITVR